jgi:aspartate-semialdehyde dehydrogenase
MRLGVVGWRGMVGSVLRQRMAAEGDWEGLQPTFFSTSNPGGEPPPDVPGAPPLGDAMDVDALAVHDVIVTCQGSSWTRAMHPRLRAAGWDGIWIDASSALRMEPSARIVLDPLNRDRIDAALRDGIRDFVGGNCTVSLMLLAVGGLIRTGTVRWISTMSYQAASGAGARQMVELVRQMADIAKACGEGLDDGTAPLVLERRIRGRMRDPVHPTDHLGHPLAGSLLPFIDAPLPSGQSREEWKAGAEANKMLGLDSALPIDGICVRTGTLRCHAQALTIALDGPVDLPAVEAALRQTSPWTRFVPNEPAATLAQLTPTAVSGGLDIAVGRVRPLATDPSHLAVFTVGDQLLWGAAEPLRRMLAIVRGRL